MLFVFLLLAYLAIKKWLEEREKWDERPIFEIIPAYITKTYIFNQNNFLLFYSLV